MNIGIIGRSSIMYDTIQMVIKSGHQISFIVTAKAAPEYNRTDADFEKLALELDVPFLYSPKVNLEELKELIGESEIPPVVLSVNYTSVIASDLVNYFPLGVLNLHGGDLPRYRGNACQAWAIINKESRMGLCVHRMEGGKLDSGNIIARAYREILPSTRVGELYAWMDQEGPILYMTALNQLGIDDSFVLEKQSEDSKDILRCYPRKPSDGEIHWNAPSDDILRLINASSEPFSGAFCSLNDQDLRIWRAEFMEDSENFLAIPGQVLEINQDKGSVVVATASGKLQVLEVSLNGVRQEASKLIKSRRARLTPL